MSIPYGRQSIDEQDCEAVLRVLRSSHLTQGPAVEEFEKGFAHFVGATGAVAVANGTAALHLACLALGVKPGQRVLVSGNTFAASANAVLYCGGDVEFVDLNPHTLCLDLAQVRQKVQSSAPGTYAGVVAVDFAGYPCQLDQLQEITKPAGMWILEDACHAPGAEYQDRSGAWIRSGSNKHSDLAIFSFHPVKHIATGEGGMVTVRNPDLLQKLRLLRTHGITKNAAEFTRPSDGDWYMEMQELGWNYRMPDILCALGTSQLRKMPGNLERRRQIADRYQRELAGPNLTLPESSKAVRHAYHLYVIRTKERKALFDHLKADGIYAQVHYIPVYQHPFYQKKYGVQKLPQNDLYYEQCLSIPMYHGLLDSEQTMVIESIQKFFQKTRLGGRAC